jgi:hypothetical protein
VRVSRRSAVAGILFAMIAIGALDRSPWSRILGDAYPDGRTSDYPQFLEEVARRTAPGDTIAILVPMKSWSRGQSYAYYRASYFLAGRKVIPLLNADDSRHPERLREARYLAVWKMEPPAGPYTRAWSGHTGVLLRRLP